jgi:tetratricopeptide (TPR) repeat protein
MNRYPVWALVLVLLAGCAAGRGSRGGADERVYLHKLEPGESLADVAAEYYGDPTRAKTIARFNDVEEPVAPGTTLRVPMAADDVARLKVREQAREPYNKGIELAENGAYIDAVTQFRSALAIDPDFVDAHYNLGVTLQKLNSNEKALEQFKDVVRLRPDDAQYRHALGNCYFHLERYADAVDAFEAAIKRDPRNTKALYSLAVSYEKLGRRDDAIAAWQRYLEIDNTSVWATEARKRLNNLQ